GSGDAEPVISSVLRHDLAIPGITPIHDALPIRNGRSASPSRPMGVARCSRTPSVDCQSCSPSIADEFLQGIVVFGASLQPLAGNRYQAEATVLVGTHLAYTVKIDDDRTVNANEAYRRQTCFQSQDTLAGTHQRTVPAVNGGVIAIRLDEFDGCQIEKLRRAADLHRQSLATSPRFIEVCEKGLQRGSVDPLQQRGISFQVVPGAFDRLAEALPLQ